MSPGIRNLLWCHPKPINTGLETSLVPGLSLECKMYSDSSQMLRIFLLFTNLTTGLSLSLPTGAEPGESSGISAQLRAWSSALTSSLAPPAHSLMAQQCKIFILFGYLMILKTQYVLFIPSPGRHGRPRWYSAAIRAGMALRAALILFTAEFSTGGGAGRLYLPPGKIFHQIVKT